VDTEADICERFRALHYADAPLLLPNAWDRGTAKLFAFVGFAAVATTSGGHAATLGRLDGRVTLDEILEHAGALAGATDVPINVDFENGFADDPAGVAANVSRIRATGVAGCSVEDFTRRHDDPIYETAAAAARVEAAAEVAHGQEARLVLTARAENYLHGRPDLGDTIARLQAYQVAGADVLYAPGLSSIDDIRTLVSSVDLPVNVLALPNVPPVPELAGAGVRRVSVGSAFNRVALGAVVDAARELLEQGTYGFWQVAASAAPATDAFR
jgi:2-methylisocitrate lyase-like PEP mutase family enzyme